MDNSIFIITLLGGMILGSMIMNEYHIDKHLKNKTGGYNGYSGMFETYNKGDLCLVN